ncbi:F5/8 type C domain protein [compost metagenome]
MGNPTSPFTFEGGNAGDSHYWSLSHSTTLPHSLTIDLGKEFQSIEGMSFGSKTGSTGRRTIPKGFYVETSSDGAKWTRVYTHTEGLYEPFAYFSFSMSVANSRYVRITITEHNALATESAISCIAVYSGYHGNVDDPLEDERAWGLTARLQGLMIVPEGTITDNGTGVLTLGGAVSIMNPASGTYFRVKSGTYTLDRWSYLYVDIPNQHGVLIDPYVAVWSPGIRAFDKKDRIILAQRNGGNEIFLHSAIHSKLAGTNPNADKVDGIDFQTKNGFLEFNDGSGWKGVGIKSVQRGATSISFFAPNGNGSLMKDITITAVNTQKSFINISTSGLAHWSQGSTMMDGSVCARFIAPDKLRFNFMDGFFEAYAEISWEVIEYA